ncbi:MAG: hypothetical protein EA361_17595 [Bacteroidetes bacterium]|nr:MAG: hypothetical protein EA361_17595 [Bacteroidota bacterium]
MVKENFLVTGLFLLWMLPAAVAQFTLSGEIRPRTEYREGYRRMPLPEEKPAGFVYQRTRLNLQHQHQMITTYVSFQDVRVWGQSSQKTLDPAMEIHQAWVELFFKDSLFLKVGRQHLQYDNQRFLAINNWLQQGQKHDVVLLKYLTQRAELHVGAAFNQKGQNINQNLNNFGTHYPVNNYKFMSFLWLHAPLFQGARLSLLGIADGYENQQSHALYVRGTIAPYFTWASGNLQFMLNPGFQNGRTVNGQQIEARYLRSELGWRAIPLWRTSLGAEYFSGNDATQIDSKYRVFDPTHGTGHAHNGYMDYFTNFAVHTRGAGLLNPFWKNRFTTGQKLTFDIDLHLFYLGNEYVVENQPINRYLGLETDFTLNYTINEAAQLQLGYSVMFGTSSMEVIRGGSKDEWAHWAFAMLTVRPVFFKQ